VEELGRQLARKRTWLHPKRNRTLKIKWVVSLSDAQRYAGGHSRSGIPRMQQVVVHNDTPAIRGMILKVGTVVAVEA